MSPKAMTSIAPIMRQILSLNLNLPTVVRRNFSIVFLADVISIFLSVVLKTAVKHVRGSSQVLVRSLSIPVPRCIDTKFGILLLNFFSCHPNVVTGIEPELDIPCFFITGGVVFTYNFK